MSAYFADAVVQGVDRDTTMTVLPIIEGREANEGNEVVLSSGLAKKLDAGAGDVVRTEVFGRTISFEVVGVTSDVVSDLATVPLLAAQEIFEWHDWGGSTSPRCCAPARTSEPFVRGATSA